MNYKCELEEHPAQPTLCIRTRVAVQDLPQILGKAFGQIAGYLGQLGEQFTGAPYVAYFNMDMQNLEIEVGAPVARPLPGQGEVLAGEFPGGKLATCLYVGPYKGIGPAYETLSKWVDENAYEVTGVAYELYLNDPATTPPEQLMTRICYPIKTLAHV